MSRWEDLLSEPSPEPERPEPTAEPLLAMMRDVRPIELARKQAAEQLATSLGLPVEVVDAAWTSATPSPVYQFDGPEPPPHVIRLDLIKGSGGYKRPNDSLIQLARVPRGPNGESRGWWWTTRDSMPVEEQGWLWGTPPRNRLDYQMHQTHARVWTLGSDFTLSLVRALPFDGDWYQIGVNRDNVPVWAWINAYDDYDIETSPERPED